METYRKIYTACRMIVWFITAYYIAAVVIGFDRFDTPWAAVPLFVCIICALLLGIWERKARIAINASHNNKKLHPYAVISLVCLPLAVAPYIYMVYVSYMGHEPLIVLISLSSEVLSMASLITIILSLYFAPLKGTHKSLGAGTVAAIYTLTIISTVVVPFKIGAMVAVKTGLVSYASLADYAVLIWAYYIICILITALLLLSGLDKYKDYAIYQSAMAKNSPRL